MGNVSKTAFTKYRFALFFSDLYSSKNGLIFKSVPSQAS